MVETEISLEEINRRLAQAHLQLEEKQSLEEQLNHARRRLGHESARLPELQAQHQQHQRYVNALENRSALNLLYSLMGKKEQALYLKRREANAAWVRYLQCREQIRMVHREMEDLERRLAGLDGPEADYQELLRLKENLILDANDETTDRLNRIEEALQVETFRIEKYKDLLQVGQSALQGFWRAVREIEDTDRVWEAFGNELVVKAMRRDRINEAWVRIREAEPVVSHFQRQLAEIETEAEPEEREDIYAFLHVVQPLIRSLNASHNTPAMIEQAIQRVQTAYPQLEKILSRLTQSLAASQREFDFLVEEKKRFLESSS